MTRHHSYVNGNAVYLDEAEEIWRYDVDDEIVDHARPRPCPLCFELPKIVDGIVVDACLGQPLPGVSNACCGHGIEGQGYIQLNGESPRTVIKVEDSDEAWRKVGELGLS